MELLIFFAFAFILPIPFLRMRTDEIDNVLDSKTSRFIKGILCIFVMLHNLGLDYLHTNFPDRNYTGWLWVTENITESTGGIAVGVFFFLSAYGLIISYNKNGNRFLKKLMTKNFIKLYFVAVFINLLEFIFFFRNSFETKDAILRILNLDLFNNFNRMNRHGWFIASLLAIYIIFSITFYICSKLKNKNKNYIAGFIVAGIVLFFKLLTLIFDNGGMYTRELPCFAIGLIYGMYYIQINKFCKKYFIPLLIVSFVAYGVGMFFYEPVASWGACVFIITLLQKFTLENKVISGLGSICLGIYLFLHLSTLIYADKFISNAFAWVFINAVTIFAFTFALEFIIKIISFLINKISIKISQKKQIN